MRAVSFVFTLSIGTAALAQTAPRQLSLTPGVRIGVSQIGAARDLVVVAGPGRIVLTTRYGGGDITPYDTSGKPLPWKLSTGRRNDESEILYVGRMGWVGGTNTMWVADPGYKQVVLIDAQGKVTKSIENPSWLHPHWADRRKYPLFASMEPIAVYPDSSMLVLPSRERSPIETPGFDRSVQHVLRVAWGGAIQKTIALLPSDDEARLTTYGPRRSQHTTIIPFATRTMWSASSDGMRFVVVTPTLTVADSGTFRVTALDDHGDTVFSRRYPQPAVRLTQAEIDNFLANLRGFDTTSAEHMRAAAMKRMPPFRSYVTGVLVGHDHSVWVLMRPVADTARERSALVLDPRGDVVGTVGIPLNQTPEAVDRDHLWAVEPARNNPPPALIRYKLETTAAPPSRTAPASTSSKPSRPPG